MPYVPYESARFVDFALKNKNTGIVHRAVMLMTDSWKKRYDGRAYRCRCGSDVYAALSEATSENVNCKYCLDRKRDVNCFKIFPK